MAEVFEEEIEVLKSIYGDDIDVVNVELDHVDMIGQLIYKDPDDVYAVYVDVPSGYPAIAPVLSISTSRQHSHIRNKLEGLVMTTITESLGNVMLFNLIELIRDNFSTANAFDKDSDNHIEDVIEDCYIPEKPLNITSNPSIRTLEVFHGPITTEQKSSFQAHFAFVYSMDEVNLFRDIVYEDKRVARATHNIFAYRFICPKTNISHHDQDDDGETAAGGRLSEMIRLMKVENVAVIVSRWFGGILLGPDRFKFICNSARDLLEAHGLGHAQASKKR
jgi:hypothetical protein